MIFPPLFAFFGKTRSADSGHDSLSRGCFGGAVVRVFGVDEVEGWGVVKVQGKAPRPSPSPFEMRTDRGHPPTPFGGC